MNRSVLNPDQITAHMQGLPDWETDGLCLKRTLLFAGFPEAVSFINQLVEPAEQLNHHPDIQVVYNRVVIRLSTHEASGLTELDFILAGLINGVVRAS